MSRFASSSRSPSSAKPASSSRSMQASSVSVVTPGCSSATSFTRHTSFATRPPSSREPAPYPDRASPHDFACSHANPERQVWMGLRLDAHYGSHYG